MGFVSCFWEAAVYQDAHLLLGGAAVHRCDKGLVLNTGFSRRGRPSLPSEFFSRLLSP